MNRKKILWMVLSVILAGLSIFAVVSQSKSFSMDEFYNDIVNANNGWLALAVLCMFGFIVFEALALRCIVNGIMGKGKHRHSFLYSASDIYFSAITPSATGGQPASAYFMMKDGIPGPIVTVTLIINLIMYTLALVSIGIVSVIIRPEIIGDFGTLSRIIVLAGLLVLIVLTVIFFFMLRKERLVYSVADKGIRLAGRLHLIRHVDRKLEKLHKTMKDYHESVRIAHGKTGMLVKAFIFNVLQRLSIMSVTVIVFLATGGTPSLAIDVWAIQSFTTIGSNCVPIPGAMGVADYLMIDGFSSVPEIASPANLELFSRSLSFYSLIVFSAIVTLIGYIVQRRRIKRRHK